MLGGYAVDEHRLEARASQPRGQHKQPKRPCPQIVGREIVYPRVDQQYEGSFHASIAMGRCFLLRLSKASCAPHERFRVAISGANVNAGRENFGPSRLQLLRARLNAQFLAA